MSEKAESQAAHDRSPDSPRLHYRTLQINYLCRWDWKGQVDISRRVDGWHQIIPAPRDTPCAPLTGIVLETHSLSKVGKESLWAASTRCSWEQRDNAANKRTEGMLRHQPASTVHLQNAGGQAFTPEARRLGGVLSRDSDQPKTER